MIFPERSKLAKPKLIYQPYQRGNSDFFDHLALKTTEKEILRQQIASISISHQLDEKTTNIPLGQRVKQILVLEIVLNTDELDKDLIEILDSRLGMYVIFKVIPKKEDPRYIIHYKEALKQSKDGQLYKIIRRFETENLVDLNYGVTNLDEFYSQMVKEVAGDDLIGHTAQDISSAIAKDKEVKKLEKEAESFKKKMYTAKAMRQQMEYKKKYQQLLAEIENLKK